jgi:putative ABC transport system substrate-binding protein
LRRSHRLPAVYAAREFVDTGGLIAYAVSFPDLYRRAATYVDKILKGAKPSDLPIQQPTKFALVINLKAAKALGLTISESFLLREPTYRRTGCLLLHESAAGRAFSSASNSRK